MATPVVSAAEFPESLTNRCRLLQLPAEIRNIIYELALLHIADQAHVFITHHTDADTGTRRPTASLKTHHPLARTCRRIRAEFTPMLDKIDPTQARMLVFNIRNFFDPAVLGLVNELLERLPGRRSGALRTLVRRVILDNDFDDVYKASGNRHHYRGFEDSVVGGSQ